MLTTLAPDSSELLLTDKRARLRDSVQLSIATGTQDAKLIRSDRAPTGAGMGEATLGERATLLGTPPIEMTISAFIAHSPLEFQTPHKATSAPNAARIGA